MRRSSQAGTLTVFVLISFLPVFQSLQPSFHGLEFRSADNMLRAIRQNVASSCWAFSIRSLVGGCVEKSLDSVPGFAFFLSLQLLEERNDSGWIVAGLVGILHT